MTDVWDHRALMDRIGGEREQPRNLDVEQALLGAILMHNDAYRRVADIVSAEQFSEEVHKRVWRVVATLIEKGTVANPATCRTFLGDADLGGMTVSQYLARLVSEATTVVNAPDYARTVRDLWVRRELIKVGAHIQNVAFDSPVEATSESMFGEIEGHLETLRPRVSPGADDYADFDIGADEALGRAEAAYKSAGMLIGHSTGLPRLDEALAGLQPANLIIIAGRPGMGKSALGTNIALAVSRVLKSRRDDGERTGVVAFTSLEMSREELSQRIIADIADVASFKLRRGIATEREMERYIEARRSLRGLPLKIDHTGGLSIDSLRIRARSLKKRQGLELLVVDYLQLLGGGAKTKGRREQNRTQEVTEITTGLKALAKELEVPIIALAQLSRSVEEREDRRPQLRDLRESGSIEQDADTVLFIYRDDYYLKKAEPPKGSDRHAEWERQLRRVEGIAQVLIAKNRHGPETTVELGFDGAYTRFTNEPERREDEGDADQRPQRKKAPKISPKALLALGFLRNLNLMGHAVENKGDLGNVPRSVRPIPYAAWRERCAEQLLDADRSEAAAAKLMETIVPDLKSAEMIGRGGSKDAAFVWLTEKGQG